MVRFVGCDVHKRTAVFTILLEEGTVLATYTVPVIREALATFAQRQLGREDRLAMEATTNTWAVAEVLRPFVGEVVISNPLRVWAIAEAKIKTDKVDSRVLAELLRCDYLPRVWQPDPETQRLRRLTHRRAALVSDRTRLKNRLHSILHHTLVPLPAYDLFSKTGIAWLRQVALEEEEAQARESDLRLLDQTEEEIAAVDAFGAGVHEYRIDFGPGYRIYFGKDGERLVILLGGGTKKRQETDIATALARWQDYKQRKGTER